MQYRSYLSTTRLFDVAAVLTTLIAATLVTYFTGGRDSLFLFLLVLPVILAVVRCGVEVVFCLGALLACVYLFALPGPDGLHIITTHDAARALMLAAVTFVGGLYAGRMRREDERLRETVEEQEALLNVSEMIDASDSLEHAVNAVLLLLREMVPCADTAAIFLADENHRALVQEAVAGSAPGIMGFDRIAIPEDRTAWPLQGVEPIYVPDAGITAGPMAGYDPMAASYVCFVLRSMRVPTGLLYVGSHKSRAFDVAQMRMLQAFCDRMAFPLRKIRMQQRLESLAFSDPMTGLYNFRAFRSHLDDEHKRAQRYGHNLSLIILDLDGFKGVNDRYGHPAGDRLLASVATIIRSCVRETDLPARYGGEEFAVICPETDHDEAELVAERIRRSVEEARFQVMPDETCAVTMSVGVASCPLHAQDEITLVDIADSALYCAKRTGKNRVVVADTPLYVAARVGGVPR